MSSFDIDNYLRLRTDADSKLQQLADASQQKVAELSAIKAQTPVKQSWSDQMGLTDGSFMSNRVNDAASIVSGTGRLAGQITSLPTSIASGAATDGVLASDYPAYNRTQTGQSTPADLERLARESAPGRGSVLDRFKSAESLRGTSRKINNFFDVTSIVDQGNRDALGNDLKQGFEPAWGKVTEGWDANKPMEVVSGLASLFATAGSAVLNNPSAVREYALENAPQLFVGLLGKAGQGAMAASNIGYAADTFQQGMENYAKANGGQLPPEAIRNDMALKAASLALAEQAGDYVGLSATKLAGGTANAAARTGFKDSLRNVGKAAAEGVASEAPTEGYQTWAEGEITGKPATPLDIYSAAVIGGASGGVLSGGGRMAAELLSTQVPLTPEQRAEKANQAKVSAAEKTSFDAAIQSGDPSAYLDKAAPTYDPAKAVAVLHAANAKPDAAPEARQANRDQANQIVVDLEDSFADTKANYLFARKSPEAKQAELDKMQARIDKLDPVADKYQIAAQQDLLTARQGMLQDLTPAQVRSTEADLSRMDRQLKGARTLQGRMAEAGNAQTTPEALAAQVSVASAPVDTNDVAAVSAAKAAATALIQMSMASPQQLSPEAAQQMYENTSSGLDDSQREYLRVFSEARKAENALQDKGSVSEDILYGNEKRQQVGLVQHRERIAGALAAGNQKAADRQLDTLSSFAVGHQAKAALITEALAEIQQNKPDSLKEVQVVRNTDTNTWERYTSVPALSAKEMADGGNVTVHRNSGKLLAAINDESSAITLTLQEMQSAYGLKFGTTASVAANTAAEVNTKPVEQKTAQVKQANAPVVPTTAQDAPVKVGGQNKPAPVTEKAPSAAVQSTSLPAATPSPSISIYKDDVGDGERVNAKASPLTAGDKIPSKVEQATAHIADNAKLKGMTFREATAQEAVLYDKVVAQVAQLFPGAAAKTSFLVHEGHAWQGGAHSNIEGGDTHIITVAAGALPPKTAEAQAKLEQYLTKLVAHELAHIQDAQEGWSTDRTPALQPGGKAYAEAMASRTQPVLEKWFGYIERNNQTYPTNTLKAREMFAQLQSLYAVHPDLMKEYLPNAYRAVTKNRAAHSARVDENQPVPDTRGRTETGGQSATETNAAVEPGVQGRNGVTETEAVQPGKLAVFGKTQPDGTLYKLRNILADFFNQKTGNDTDATSRPLVEVKNFLSQLASGAVKATDFLSTGEVLTDAQSAVLALFETKAKAWNALIQQSLVRGNRKDSSNNPEFYFNDLMQFLIESTDGDTARTNLDLEENVKTAMSFAAFSWIAENAGKSQWSTDEDINATLNRDENAEVTSTERFHLGKVGLRENVVRNGLGQKAVQALGLTLRKNAPPNEMAKLESALGAHIQKFLMQEGILQRNTVTGEVMAQLTGSDKTDKGAFFQFLKLARTAEDALPPQAEAIKAANKGSQGVLNKLFSVEPGLKEPSLTPIPFKQKTTKNTQQGIPAKLAKSITKANAEANYLRQDMWHLLGQLSPETALAMAGVEEVSDASHHAVNQASIQAKNDGLVREYERFMDYVKDVLTPLDAGLEMPLFFEHSVWKQQRVGIATNVINPQTSKIHRFLMYRKGWETTVQSTDSVMLENFQLRVLEGLGTKTDKQSNSASLAAFEAVTGTAVVQDAVAVLVKTLQGTDITAAEQATLLAGVKSGGSNFHSLDGLMALAQYETAKGAAKGKPFSFTVQMMGEVDGVANGPMLTHLLIGAAASVKDMFGLLNRGGFFEEGNPSSQYNLWRESPGNWDLYETTTANMTQAAQRMASVSDAMQRGLTAVYAFTGPLTEDDKVTKAGRNIIKTPLTAMLFGSSIEKSVDSMADKFVESIYGKIEDLAQGKGDLAQTIAHLNTLLGRTERIRPDTTVAQLMGQEFSRSQTAALKDSFKASLGEAVKATLESDFSTFIASRKAFNQTAKLSFDLYDAVHRGMQAQLISELVQKEKDAPGTGIATAIVNRVATPIHGLSAAQEQELQTRIQAVLPVLHTLMSQESGDLKSGLFMAKTARMLSTRGSHKGSVQFATPFADNGAYSASTSGYETVQANPGVAMLPMSIHSTDSYISHMAANLGEVLNVHDAHGAGLATFEQTARNLNEATWNAMMGYSPAAQMQASLGRVITGLDALLQTGTVPPEVVTNLNQVLQDTAKKQKSTPDAVLDGMLMAITDMAYQADSIKYGALAQMASVDQYALEGGNYAVTPAQRAEAAAKAAALTGEVSAELKASLDGIAAQLKNYKAPAKVAPAVQLETPTSSGMDDSTDNDAAGTARSATTPPIPYSTTEMYTALADPSKPLSPAFDGQLRELLGGIVQQLHGPFGVFKETLMKEEPLTADGRLLKAQSEGKAPLISLALSSGIQFSSQEAFVMEQVEATVKAALTANDGQSAAVYRELSRLFMEARKRIQPGDFATGNAVQDQAIYDFLFNHQDARNGNRDDYLARFAAVGLAHEGFNALLQVETARAGEEGGKRSIAATLKRLFDKLLEWFNGKLTHTVAGQRGDQKLDALVKQLVSIEVRRQARVADTSLDLVGTFDDKSKAFAELVAKKAGELGRSDFFKQNKIRMVGAAGAVVSMVAEDRVKFAVEHINKIRDAHFDKGNSLIAGVFKDAVGYAQIPQLMLRMRNKLDGERKALITDTGKLLRSSFANAGEGLTDQNKAALTQVLLRTGAHTLLGDYDTRQLQVLLSDPVALQSAIAAQEAKLSGYAPKFQNYFRTQSKVLAHFMVTAEAKGVHLMKNAGNIARLYETPMAGQLNEQEMVDAEPIIDALVSLYALQRTAAQDKQSVVDLLAAEHARSDEGNGVQMALLLHKDLEIQAKERLFGDSPALMVKGYTPEIYNPYTDLRVANAEEGQRLVEQGYVPGPMVAQDAKDPSADSKQVFTLKDGGPPQLLTGIISYTAERHKGSTLHGGQNTQLQQRVQADKQADILKLFDANPGFDPATVKQNFMVPLLNGNGEGVNYQYLMHADTKDTLLERNSRFDDVLGVQAGSVFDKQTAPEHNVLAVKALHDDYLADFVNNPKAYVNVGPRSPNVEQREIYRLLPRATQQAITTLWGKNGMMVRGDMMDINFGYHKLSLANVYDKLDPNAVEKAFMGLVDGAMKSYAQVILKMTKQEAQVYAKRAQVVVRRGENIWQAIVREIKDIYVIKAVTTMLNNIVSNLSLLGLYGVPVLDSLRYHQEAMQGISAHQDDTAALFTLETQARAGYGTQDKAEVRREIARLKDAIARNPVTPLIEGGLMPTIVEDVAADVDPFSYKSQFLRKTEKYTSKLNPKVRQAARIAYMSHDTQAYKTLHHFTQLSDFVARYVLYQHATTRKNNPLGQEAAILEASEAFINYDIPMHRNLQYTDDMGLTMFTKYFLRIQRVLVRRVKENPGRVMATLLLHQYVTTVPGVMDASALAHFGNNPFGVGAIGFPGALPDIATAGVFK